MERAPIEKKERPRDELGRPLPWGSENKIVLENYEALSIDEDYRLGIAHFNAGRFFAAHEAWEGAWRQARGSEDEEFFKGLAQLGAGYTHYLRGNPHGAITLVRRAIERIGLYAPSHHGIDVPRLIAAGGQMISALTDIRGRREKLPEIPVPTL